MSYWVALQHTPGADFAEPALRDHYAFLRDLHARGWVVAAGPFADAAGSGMTVLRVPDDVPFADVERLARTEDASVAAGVLDVAVRPWRVALTSLPDA